MTQQPPVSFHTSIWAKHKGAVCAGIGSLDGRLEVDGNSRDVVAFVIDSQENGGALSERDGLLIAEAANTALEMRRPLVGILGSSGVDITGGVQALHGWGTAARALAGCSGIIPVSLVVDGPAVSGVALLLGLADIVVMTESSYAFVSGPAMVADFTGIFLDNTALGGAATHARNTGLPMVVAPDLASALDRLGEVLGYLPDHADASPPIIATHDSTERDAPELDDIIPASSTGSYDVRKVIAALSDDGEFLELRARWAPNLVTGFAAIGGRPIGIVANQPLSLAGTLDIGAAQKGAAFVSLCDSFNLAIVTLVDTPGYFPGKDLEWRGMIRHGAQMAFAYAEATVARVCVVLRKAYGLGAQAMAGGSFKEPFFSVAWPTGEFGGMGLEGQVKLGFRNELAAIEDPKERLARYENLVARAYERSKAIHQGVSFGVDDVIDPMDTRRWVGNALATVRPPAYRTEKKRRNVDTW